MTQVGAGGEGGEGQGGGGGGAEDREGSKRVSKWRSTAASLAAACSVLVSASGVQASQVKPRPVSLSLRASRASWYLEDRASDVSDAVVDVYDTARGAVRKAAKEKSGVVKAGAGVAFVLGSVVGLKRVAKGVEVEEVTKELMRPIGVAEGLIGDGWSALSAALDRGTGGGMEQKEGGESRSDRERQRRREKMFAQIEAKVERGGTSSLTADEFQLMYSELNDMIRHGDSAMREVSEEELQSRRMQREKRREERRARLEAQGEIDMRIKQRINARHLDEF